MVNISSQSAKRLRRKTRKFCADRQTNKQMDPNAMPSPNPSARVTREFIEHGTPYNVEEQGHGWGLWVAFLIGWDDVKCCNILFQLLLNRRFLKVPRRQFVFYSVKCIIHSNKRKILKVVEKKKFGGKFTAVYAASFTPPNLTRHINYNLCLFMSFIIKSPKTKFPVWNDF